MVSVVSASRGILGRVKDDLPLHCSFRQRMVWVRWMIQDSVVVGTNLCIFAHGSANERSFVLAVGHSGYARSVT